MPAELQSFLRRAALFVALGLVLYGAAYVTSEALVYRYAAANVFYRIHSVGATYNVARPVSASAGGSSYDYAVIGSSHGMPLGFGDTNERIELVTGMRVINLCLEGGGIVPSRLVLEYFFEKGFARNVIYVFDSAVLQFREWNEDRLADVRQFRRAPLDPTLVGIMARYVARGKMDWVTALDYVAGFSKINNRERFTEDINSMERQFDRVYRGSTRAYERRVEYLFPREPSDEEKRRYLGELEEMLEFLSARGVELIAVQMPVPEAFYRHLPDAEEFSRFMREWLEARGASYYDFSTVFADQPQYFFDTDHLNRQGVAAFLDLYLAAVLKHHA